MDEDAAEIVIEETSIQRYYYSLLLMNFDLSKNEKGKEYYNTLHNYIYSYYEESLALLRSSKTLLKTLDKKEKEFEENYKRSRQKIDEAIDSASDEEIEDLSYGYSNLLQQKSLFYEDRDLERSIFAQGAIVQFLSLLESTLNSIYKEFLQIDDDLPYINDIYIRDRGIVKYLKYFENELINKQDVLLIGSPIYQKLQQWIKLRNNIVHNNNITRDFNQTIDQRHLNIAERKGKFIFDDSHINSIAEICGEILDVIINEFFKLYFLNTGVISE